MSKSSKLVRRMSWAGECPMIISAMDGPDNIQRTFAISSMVLTMPSRESRFPSIFHILPLKVWGCRWFLISLSTRALSARTFQCCAVSSCSFSCTLIMSSPTIKDCFVTTLRSPNSTGNRRDEGVSTLRHQLVGTDLSGSMEGRDQVDGTPSTQLRQRFDHWSEA